MNEHLNSAQLLQIQKAANEAMQVAVDKMQLRKWAVEQSIIVTCSPSGIRNLKNPSDPIELALAIYDFISQAAVVKVEIGP